MATQLSPFAKYLAYQLYHAIHLISKIASDGKSDDIHQFRVAIRRVRSLNQLYLEHTPLPLEPLKSFVKQTNILREIDVLLSTIKSENYPKTFKRITALRNGYLHSIFTDLFKHDATHALNRSYDAVYDLNPDLPAAQMTTVAEDYYRHCCDEYRMLRKESTKKEFHRLRIKFKIARYGLEFLNDSDTAEESEKIKECKRFQDGLGDIQDTYNQISWLKKFYIDYPIKEVLTLIQKRKKKLKELKKARVSTLSA